MTSEEKKHLEVLDPATMWYIFLGMVLFSVPSEIILKYREECVEIHKRAISVTCGNAYKASLVRYAIFSHCFLSANVSIFFTSLAPLSAWFSFKAAGSHQHKWFSAYSTIPINLMQFPFACIFKIGLLLWTCYYRHVVILKVRTFSSSAKLLRFRLRRATSDLVLTNLSSRERAKTFVFLSLGRLIEGCQKWIRCERVRQ